MPATTRSVVVFVASMLSLAPTALACPRCYTSELVWRAVTGPGFFLQLLIVALPFIVLGSIALSVHRFGDRFGARIQRTQSKR